MISGYKILFIIFILISCNTISKKEIKVQLTKRTILDTNTSSLHPFYHSIPQYIKAPDLSGKKVYWADIRQLIFGKKLSYLVVKEKDYDLLYIDFNGDSNLTNDGNPKIFPLKDNSFSFKVFDPLDSKRYIELVFQRKPIGNNSVKNFENIPEPVVKIYQKNVPDFEGKKGTYYYVNGKMLSRGQLQLNDTTYDIGILDTDNGLFNDISNNSYFGGDLLLIDFNHDHKLSFLYSNETFYLDEVFKIGKKNYRLKNVDKYGRFLVLTETNEKVTNHFIQKSELISSRRNLIKFTINSEFWDETFISLDGKKIKMSSFKGKYILLNFWGERCAPCVNELPDLIDIFNKYRHKNLILLSFLKTKDKKKALKIINNLNIKWPQILFLNEHQKYFNITGFPTNILITPKGEAIKRVGNINRIFIGKYIE